MGYTPRGNFTTKEAYNLLIGYQDGKDPMWGKIWTPVICPKISKFLWLLCHKRILTWDNLRKKSFHGPSRCPNCNQQEETIQHLMYTCRLANKLWEKIEFRCQKRGKVIEVITNTIRNWTIEPYKSRLLNSLWKIIPGLLVWTLWKERNGCIFKNQCTPLDIIWHNFCNNLQETVALQNWHEEDLPTLPQEKNIRENWHLSISQTHEHSSNISQNSNVPSQWKPPSQGMIHIKF